MRLSRHVWIAALVYEIMAAWARAKAGKCSLGQLEIFCVQGKSKPRLSCLRSLMVEAVSPGRIRFDFPSG